MSGIMVNQPIMPRPAFPPTPAASTDISGKTSSSVAQFDATFSLPPAALSNRGSVSSSNASNVSNSSDSSYRPLSPTSPAASTKAAPVSRKRPSTSQGVVTKDDYSLPPPPTRSRKIIQMKPRTQETEEANNKAQSNPSPASKTAAPATGTGSKKKQANNTTAAGRKIARKTAHSLIERRRRSKMNEEFGVLKDMIPACAGQEMHKLAILQASIEYMRYLEQCVADLKASHRLKGHSSNPITQKQPPQQVQKNVDEDDDEDEDEEMSDAVSPMHVLNSEAATPQAGQSTTTSPNIYPSDHNPYSTNPSPSLRPSDTRHYSVSASPALQPSDPHHYSLTSSIRSTATSPSIQPSPAFSAQSQSQSYSQFRNPFHGSVSSKGSTFSLTSPALGPQPDREDHEATEALLMLNTDRRSWNGGRGMSVKDLLSG